MQWSYRIARIGETEIKVHGSFILIVAYVLFLSRPRGLRDIVFPLAAVVLIFACVALHELGHSFAARRFGITVSSIILWPLGGFAVMGRQASRPAHELMIAGAGPFVNLVLALIAQIAGWGAVALIGSAADRNFGSLGALLFIQNLLSLLVGANLSLALFNLLPAFPLDGGRMLRALLQMLVGESRAAPVMLWLSWLVVLGVGVYAVARRDPLMIAIALLLFLGAGTLNERFTQALERWWARLFDPGLVALRSGDYARAIELFSRTIARSPRHSMAHNNRGAAHFHRMDYGLALRDYCRAIDLQPDFALALRNRYFLYNYCGEYQLALADLDRLCQLEPANLVYRRLHAYTQHLAGDNAQALAELGQLLEGSDRGAVLLSRSIVYMAQRLFDLARKDLEQALIIDPSNAAAHNNTGYLEYLLGDYAAGLRACERGLALDSKLGPLLTTRAEIYAAQGEAARAVSDYSSAIELNPHDFDAQIFRSLALFAQGDDQQARADFAHVLAIAPRKALVHAEVTLERKISGQLDWVLMCYASALDRRPSDPLVYQGRADGCRVNGAFERAVADYDFAISLAPDQPAPYIGRGLAYAQLGEHARAAASFEQALALNIAPDSRLQAEAQLRLTQAAASSAGQ